MKIVLGRIYHHKNDPTDWVIPLKAIKNNTFMDLAYEVKSSLKNAYYFESTILNYYVDTISEKFNTDLKELINE